MRTDLTIRDIKSLAPSWRTHAMRLAHEPPILSMGMVGLKLMPTTMEFQNPLDESLLEAAVTSLDHLGCQLSPLVRVKHMNADATQGGLDLFDCEESMDVLLLGNLFWTGEAHIASSPDYYVSPQFKTLADIVTKAESLNVKYIFTKSCGVSVSVRAFQDHGPYVMVYDDDPMATGDITATGFAVHRDAIPSLRAGAYTAAL